jgi:hypothetical protein
MKPVGKPDAGKLHVRFDERGGETERAKAPPRLSSTLLKRQKNDATDAEAICEAVTRANMRFVPTKTFEQQSCLMLHRTRHLFRRTIEMMSCTIPPRTPLVVPLIRYRTAADRHLCIFVAGKIPIVFV